MEGPLGTPPPWLLPVIMGHGPRAGPRPGLQFLSGSRKSCSHSDFPYDHDVLLERQPGLSLHPLFREEGRGWIPPTQLPSARAGAWTGPLPRALRLGVQKEGSALRRTEDNEARPEGVGSYRNISRDKQARNSSH